MLPILLGGIAIVSAIVYLLTDDEPNYTDMANSHNQFLQFEQNISLTSAKKTKLIASRKALQDRIVAYFKTKPAAPIPKFYIQGSYKMKTMVLDKLGTYDVDLGVYFLTKPNIEPYTLQKWVFEAVKGHTSAGAEHREKCIRVKYAGDFDIDLPVYYKTHNDRHPYLAAKTGWQPSDPKELCDWFEKKRNETDRTGQLLRLVKYFKKWANTRTRKMPSGIAFSVWVTNHYKPNTRDDVAFYETAKAIKESFLWNLSCKNPATPNDDFIAKLDQIQKSNFKDALSNLIKFAELAIKSDNQTSATNIWRQQFGDKFPLK